MSKTPKSTFSLQIKFFFDQNLDFVLGYCPTGNSQKCTALIAVPKACAAVLGEADKDKSCASGKCTNDKCLQVDGGVCAAGTDCVSGTCGTDKKCAASSSLGTECSDASGAAKAGVTCAGS